MCVVAIVGATGIVGRELICLLEQRSFPLTQLKLFASHRSRGTPIPFQKGKFLVEVLSENSLDETDIAFLCAGAKVSKKIARKASQKGTVIIDLSSAHRLEESVPLIIPEINSEKIDISTHPLIASPNCTTSLILMALAPLHSTGRKLKAIHAVSIQAASGFGQSGLEELIDSVSYTLAGRKTESQHFPEPLAFNLFHHESEKDKKGYAEEEIKIRNEIRKILDVPDLPIAIRSLRAGIMRSHTIALNITFEKNIALEEIEHTLKQVVGIRLYPRPKSPSPLKATFSSEVHVGGLRYDLDHPNSIEIIICGDQLLKGAALNAIQIAELVVESLDIHSSNASDI